MWSLNPISFSSCGHVERSLRSPVSSSAHEVLSSMTVKPGVTGESSSVPCNLVAEAVKTTCPGCG